MDKPKKNQLNQEQLNHLANVTSGTNTFTLEIYKALSKTNPKTNVVASPLSLQVTLALACVGATGKTAEEISTMLHCPDTKKMIQGHQSIVSLFKNPSLKFGTKVFIDKSLNPKEDFIKNASTNFESEVDKMNFRSDRKGAVQAINNWANSKTSEKIKTLVSDGDLNDKTDLILVNVTYFKANWKVAFSEGATCAETFYVTEKETPEIDMMFKSGKYGYLEHADLDAKILEIRYEGDEFSMFIFLPNEITGLQKLQEAISKINLTNVLKGLGTCAVDVTLPKFEINDKICFNEILNSLGVKAMFNAETADFSNISSSKIAVTKIIQKTCIQVDEKGPDKVHATGKSVASNILSNANDDDDDGESFKANHPFLFIISKAVLSNILIMLIGKFTGK